MTLLSRWKPLDDLARWNPFEDGWMLTPREFLSRKRATNAEFEWTPRCDVTESDGVITVHAELPGVEAKDVDVAIEGTMLVIRGEKRTEKAEKEKGQTYQERFFGSFERRVAVPEGVDTAAIEAKLKDGVLEVRVPLPAKPVPEAKKVEIKAG